MTKSSPKIVLTGAVLAGGKSSRMGRNKALLRVDGQPLWRRQLRVLRDAGAHPVLLVQAPGQRALTRSRTVRIIRDTTRNAGPLAGLHAALVATSQAASRGPARPQGLSQSNGERRDSAFAPTHLAILAVDLPHLTPDWFIWLAAACTRTTGAVVRSARGYEPLAALYPQSALAATTAALAAGDYSLQKLIATLVRTKRLKVLRVPASRRPQLANWNTPADIG